MSDPKVNRYARQRRQISGPHDVAYGVDCSNEDPTKWVQFGWDHEANPVPRSWETPSPQAPAGRRPPASRGAPADEP